MSDHPSARAALLVSTLLVAATLFVAPASGLNPSFHSGEKPLDPINIRWAKVNGATVTSADAVTLQPVKLEFKVTNNPKSVTFNGVTTPLFAEAEVLVKGFEGTYSITSGNIKISGTALYWELCNGDRDGDGLLNCEERERYRTNPDDPDTDDDGLNDGREVQAGTNPLRADSDGDGLMDGEELALGTDPLRPDTDGDGLSDASEVRTHGTDPRVADTDGGGANDGRELQRGTDPLDPTDDAYVQLWTEDGPSGTRGAPIAVAWVKAGGRYLANESLSGDLGVVSFDTVGEQYISVNGTDVKVFEGDIVTLEDFSGLLSKSTRGGTDTVVVDGIASRVFVTPRQEGTVVHSYGRIMTHENNTISVSIFQEAAGHGVTEQHVWHQLLVATPVPTYLLFDFYKYQDQLANLGQFQISFTPSEHQGHSVMWVEIFNADPLQVGAPIPVGGSPLGSRACVTVPPPPTPPAC